MQLEEEQQNYNNQVTGVFRDFKLNQKKIGGRRQAVVSQAFAKGKGPAQEEKETLATTGSGAKNAHMDER